MLFGFDQDATDELSQESQVQQTHSRRRRKTAHPSHVSTNHSETGQEFSRIRAEPLAYSMLERLYQRNQLVEAAKLLKVRHSPVELGDEHVVPHNKVAAVWLQTSLDYMLCVGSRIGVDAALPTPGVFPNFTIQIHFRKP